MPQKRHLRLLPWRGSCPPSLQRSNRFVYIRKQRAAVRELTLLLSADYGLPEDSVNVQYVRVVRKHASQVVRGNVEVLQRKTAAYPISLPRAASLARKRRNWASRPRSAMRTSMAAGSHACQHFRMCLLTALGHPT